MSCDNEHFSDKIYAYELGLLSEDEQREFEIHLLECDACFNDLNLFRQNALLLKHDPDVKKSVTRFLEDRDGVDDEATGKIVSVRPKKRWRTLVPIAAAAVLFIVLILKDWKIDIGPSKEAIAAENRIAVIYFENLAEPDDSLRYGEIAANLLITDLAESEYMQVVSSQRLYDILKLLGYEGTKIIDKSVATEVANKSGSNWLLTGSILQTKPALILTSQIINVSNGNVVATEKITGSESQNIFSVVDLLSSAIKADLALPAEAYREPDPAVADVTTHSADAYRYYLLGEEYADKFYNTDAIRCYEKAIEYDSTFAMAYYALAGLKDPSLMTKVMQYSDNVTQKEKMYILAREAYLNNESYTTYEYLEKIIQRYPDEKDAYYQLGVYKRSDQQFDTAIALLNKAVEIDPLFKNAYNILAYAYNNVGDFEKSLWAIDKYIELAPDEANPLDTKAEIYAMNGMLDNAIESYKRALMVKPDFYNSLMNLSLMYIFKQEYDKADSCIINLEDINGYKPIALRQKAYIPLYQGLFDEALRKLDIAIDSSSDRFNIMNHYFKSRVYFEQENWKKALEETDKTVELFQSINPVNRATYVYLGIETLAKSGDMDGARKKLQQLKTFVDEANSLQYTYWYASGALNMVERNYKQACLDLEKSKSYNDDFVVIFMLAKAYYLAGQYEKAIAEFESIQNQYSAQRSYFPVMSVKLYYYLALACEATGESGRAAENYKKFLDIWKNADDGLPSVDDAKARLAKLTTRS